MTRKHDPIPTGIQSLVGMASVDEAFRNELVQRRSAIAAAAGVKLTATERAILDSIPGELLQELTEQMVLPPQPHFSLLRQVARSAVVALSAGLISQAAPGCGPGQPQPAIGEQVAPEAEMSQPQDNGDPAPDAAAELEERSLNVLGPMVMPAPYNLKPAKLRFEIVAVKGPLSKEVVSRIAMRNIHGVRFCCECEFTEHQSLNGRIAIKFIVSSSGEVQTSEVANSTVSNKRLERCITDMVKNWTFPEPEGGNTVAAEIGFQFSPGREEKGLSGGFRRNSPVTESSPVEPENIKGPYVMPKAKRKPESSPVEPENITGPYVMPEAEDVLKPNSKVPNAAPTNGDEP